MRTIVGLLALGLLLSVTKPAHATLTCDPVLMRAFVLYRCHVDDVNPTTANGLPRLFGAIAWSHDSDKRAQIQQGGEATPPNLFPPGQCPGGDEFCIPHDPSWAFYQCGHINDVSSNPDGTSDHRQEAVRVTFPEMGGIYEEVQVDCRSLNQFQANEIANELAVLYMATIYAQEMAALGLNACLAFQVSATCGFDPTSWNSVYNYYWFEVISWYIDD